jgi:hypothetical protein
LDRIEVQQETSGDDPDGAQHGSATGMVRRILTGLKRVDTIFSASATAAALAEHGSREMALDQLERAYPAPDLEPDIDSDGAEDDADPARRKAS